MARQLAIRAFKPETPFATFLHRLLRSRKREMMAHYAGTLTDDPESLHDMRVGARRLRTALFLARGSFAAGRHGRGHRRYRRFKRHEQALAKVTEGLGRVRDIDVLLLYLAQDLNDAPAPDRPHLERLAAYAGAFRAERRQQMKKRLRAFARPRRIKRFEALIETLRRRSSH
jgi:CHAD domain-containing protein